MNKRKPAWDVLSDKKRKECIDKIIAYFLDERQEEIGIIAAEDLLDLLLENVSSDIYNKGVEDAKERLQEKLADINVDLDLLLKNSNNK